MKLKALRMIDDCLSSSDLTKITSKENKADYPRTKYLVKCHVYGTTTTRDFVSGVVKVKCREVKVLIDVITGTVFNPVTFKCASSEYRAIVGAA